MAGSSKAFRKHGTYVYDVAATIARYGTAALTIEAMQEAQMTHAWVRIHGQSAYPVATKRVIGAFIDQVMKVGIAVAGWGWCQGSDPEADARLAVRETASFGLSDYIADIEEGVHNSHWSVATIGGFCTRVRSGVGGSFGITTFSLIDWHEPGLMKAALPFVDMFNPQVYWHHFPNKKMVRQFKRPDGTAYSQDRAFDYADLCLDRWEKLMGDSPKDIVITGQAYWGEGVPAFSEGDAEDKVDEFLVGWAGYRRVIGLNWWHFGGSQSMSHRMRNDINKAKLGAKPYK
ncbi:hypothetical protein [Bradyrhizobium lablabi]|uniref:hypothetical protein n=1 Tax=Bradyrhizobium lablabi TaxID=722472 RepID=UPI001BAC085E|nr:hypothetical protein [Bradyrhizobium lablabi]MBR0694452.1 hypothetical protein [Bradyrhizobium lablabi]